MFQIWFWNMLNIFNANSYLHPSADKMSLNSVCLVFARRLCSIIYWAATSSSKISPDVSKSIAAVTENSKRPFPPSTVCPKERITPEDWCCCYLAPSHVVPSGLETWTENEQLRMSIKWKCNCICKGFLLPIFCQPSANNILVVINNTRRSKTVIMTCLQDYKLLFSINL